MAFRINKEGFNLLVRDPEESLLLSHNTVDAFSRVRISQPVVIFDDKHNYAKNDGTNGIRNWNYDVAGSGTSTYNTNESSVDLNVTTGATDRVTKRTTRYFPYTPAMAQTLFCTAVLGAGETGCTKRIGLFDDDNGLFFYEEDGVYGVCVRTKGTGSVVETKIVQSDWNMDSMDGVGPSEQTVDFTKTQIFVISFQWLGNTLWSMQRQQILLQKHQPS